MALALEQLFKKTGVQERAPVSALDNLFNREQEAKKLIQKQIDSGQAKLADKPIVIPQREIKSPFQTGLSEGFFGGLKSILNIPKAFIKEAVIPALEVTGLLLEKMERGYEPTGEELFSELPTKEKAKAFINEFVAQTATKAKGVGLGEIEAVSGTLGYAERFGWSKAKPMADKLDDWAKQVAPEDPDFADALASGIGSMATYYIPGALISSGLGLFSALSPTILNLVGNSAMTLLESSTEAGSVYRENLKQGNSIEESKRNADIDFGINIFLLALTNKFDFQADAQRGLASELKSRLLAGWREGIQELGQQIASNFTTYKKWDEGIKESASVGALMGLFLGGSVNPNINLNVETQQEIKDLIEQAKKSEAGFVKIPGEEPIPKELAQEARKFKTADEFIEKTTPKDIFPETKVPIKVFHGGDKEINIFKVGMTPIQEGKIFFSEHQQIAKIHGKKITEAYLDIKNPLEYGGGRELTDFKREALSNPQKFGFDGVIQFDDGNAMTEIIVFNPSQIRTKQQLTDIFNQAKAETKPFLKRVEKEITEKITRKSQRVKILANIREQKDTVQTIKQDVINYAKENLDLHEKGKLLATVKNVKTFKDLGKAKLYIEKLSEEADKRMFVGKIQKAIKKTPAKGKKPIGKFTPEIQNVLNSMKTLTDLNQKQANKQIEANLRENPVNMPPEIALENKILSLYTGTSVQKQELLNIINRLKEKGEMASALKKFNIQADIQRKRDLVVERITGGKGIEEGRLHGEPAAKTTIQQVKQYLKAIGKKTILDWRGLMIASDFNAPVTKKSLADFFSVSKNESNYKELQSNYVEDFNEAISSIYGIKNKPNSILKKINQITTEKINVDKFEMTRDELIKRYMEIQDPTLRDSFIEGNKYTEETFQAIEDKITDQDKKFAEWQMDYYKNTYDNVNEIYSKMRGVDLPFNEFYSPIRRTGYAVEPGHTEFLDEAFYRKAVTNKSLISRVKNLNPIAKQGSIEVLDRHNTDTNYYIAWAEKIRELDSIFTNNEVREAYKQEFPNSLLEAVNTKIQHIATHGNKTASTVDWVDYLRKNFVVGNLALKPALAIKQLVSTLAYAEKISARALTVGILDFAKNPIKNYKKLQSESAFIKNRGAGMERDIKDAIKGGVFDRYNKKQNLANALLLNVRLGDKGAIVLGSWAMRKQRLKEGVPLEDIITEYEEFSADTQQSADISRLSEIQLGGSIQKLFTIFKSSQRAYLQKEVNVIKSMFREDGFSKSNLRKVGRTLFIYHLLLPMIFQWVANMGGWDEEDQKEYLRAGLLGSLNGLFIAGDIIDSIIRQALGMMVWDTEVVIADIGDDIRKIISNLTEEDVSTEDMQQALEAFTSLGTGVTGLPIEFNYDILQSLYDSNYETGLLQMLGWSKYTIESQEKTTTRKLKRKSGTTNSKKLKRKK